jgi:hypothetical protein
VPPGSAFQPLGTGSQANHQAALECWHPPLLPQQRTRHDGRQARGRGGGGVGSGGGAEDELRDAVEGAKGGLRGRARGRQPRLSSRGHNNSIWISPPTHHTPPPPPPHTHTARLPGPTSYAAFSWAACEPGPTHSA